MNSSHNVAKPRNQWTEGLLFLTVFGVAAAVFYSIQLFKEYSVTAQATNGPVCTWDTSQPATQPVLNNPNLLLNGEIAHSGSASHPDGWEILKWGEHELTGEYQYNAGQFDNSSLAIQMMDWQSGGGAWIPSQPIAVKPETAYLFTNAYRATTDTKVVAEITLPGQRTRHINLGTSEPSAVWRQQTFTFYTPKDATHVRIYQALSEDGTLETDNYMLAEHQPVPLSQGMVSLTFDDGSLQIHQNALPLLDEFAIPSTQYLVSQPIFDRYSQYYIGDDELDDFIGNGHEIGSHTANHLNLTLADSLELYSELEDSQKDFITLLGQPVKNFATPYGAYNSEVVERVKHYYCSHRTTDVGINSPDSFDLYHIKVENITVETTPDEVQSWIDAASRNKTWLVIVLHEIGDEGGHYSFTPDNLKQMLEYIHRSTLKPVTMTEGIEIMLTAQHDLEK